MNMDSLSMRVDTTAVFRVNWHDVSAPYLQYGYRLRLVPVPWYSVAFTWCDHRWPLIALVVLVVGACILVRLNAVEDLTR